MNLRHFGVRAQHVAGALAAGAFLGILGCSSNTPQPAGTQVAVTASAATASLGSAITFTATLSGAKTPTGVVTFFDGATAIQPVVLSGTTATASITTLAPGAHSITAQYGGDQANGGSTSSAVAVNVTVPTTTTVSGSPTFVLVGTPITLTATVTAPFGTPTGTVTFLSGSTMVGTAAVNAQGVATTTSTTVPQGHDQLTATFQPSGFYQGSTSGTFALAVHGVLVPSNVAVTATPSGTIGSGTTLALTATIVPTTVTAVPTGTITFLDGTRTLGTVALDSTGAAALSTKFLVVGSNPITATYSGDFTYAPTASATTALTVSPYAGATYTNPLNVTDPATGHVYNCPDPAIIKSQTGGVNTWYAYCTGDAFNSADVLPSTTTFRPHLISIFSSSDLVNWTYVHDAFTAEPTWIHSGNELQTPAIKFFNGLYHLYYETPAITAGGSDSAIGVGTSATAAGPFTDSGGPVINTTTACGGGCNRTTFAPEVIADGTGQLWITYGGIFGGLSIRKLSSDGLSSVASSEINIAVDNYYQDPFLFFKNGYFYEFVTAGSCCSGPLSSNNVHVGRSTSITGPYLDAEGNDLNAYSNVNTAGEPGGEPVLVMNGNDIVGSGSNSVFTDESGQDYILYSGVSKLHPYLPGATGYTARQLMMDALDYVNGYPVARNGAGPSDFTLPQPVPAAQPNALSGYLPPIVTPDSPGTLIAASSDEFNEATLNLSQWTFLHATPTYTMTGSAYAVQSVNQESTLPSSMPNLPILTEPEPAGNYLLETRISSTVTGGRGNYIFNFNSAGLFIYSADNTYLRLDQVPVFETRQIEFVNELVPQAGYPGLSFAPVGPPNFAPQGTSTAGYFTYLRIAKRVGTGGAPDTYTAYSSQDGATYLKGPTWTASYGSTAKIGLYAGNTAGYTASFDYVHVSMLQP